MDIPKANFESRGKKNKQNKVTIKLPLYDSSVLMQN